MTISDLEHFKGLLLEKEQNLNDLLSEAGCCGEVERAKVLRLLGQIRQSLAKVEDHSYGACEICHGEVELHRLEIQPVAVVCLECISAQERATLEDELFVASKIHRALLPQRITKIQGVELEVISLAAGSIGGDYYDVLPASDGGMTRVVIADSMGKGIPAGLLMSNLQGALRILAEDLESPGVLVTRLNHWLCRNVPVIKFVTMACLGIQPADNNGARVVYANAGHCPPLLIRADGRTELLNSTGAVLGVHEEFEFEEKQLTFRPGDLLFLYTDGVTEAENERGEMFEEDRLVKFVRDHRSEPLSSLLGGLVAEVRRFSKDSVLVDDLTTIALRVSH